jgi:hypothetical protein
MMHDGTFTRKKVKAIPLHLVYKPRQASTKAKIGALSRPTTNQPLVIDSSLTMATERNALNTALNADVPIERLSRDELIRVVRMLENVNQTQATTIGIHEERIRDLEGRIRDLNTTVIRARTELSRLRCVFSLFSILAISYDFLAMQLECCSQTLNVPAAAVPNGPGYQLLDLARPHSPQDLGLPPVLRPHRKSPVRHPLFLPQRPSPSPPLHVQETVPLQNHVAPQIPRHKAPQLDPRISLPVECSDANMLVPFPLVECSSDKTHSWSLMMMGASWNGGRVFSHPIQEWKGSKRCWILNAPLSDVQRPRLSLERNVLVLRLMRTKSQSFVTIPLGVLARRPHLLHPLQTLLPIVHH